MAGSKSKGIPSWQKESSSDLKDSPIPPEPEQSPSEASKSLQNDDPVYAQAAAAATSPDTDREIPLDSSQQVSASRESDQDSSSQKSSLIESASKFLQHEDLRNATLERKIAFLEGKGLTKDEIDDLLQTQSTEETTSSTTTSSTSSPPPPIITYPEFLLHAHRPKPLVTRTRIINAVYTTGLISGALYLANRYLFEPMAEQMAVARHDLFDTAQKGVDKLNGELEKNVSVIPPAKINEDDEAESVASDPQELFHRDIGVQTSPKLEGDGSANKDITSSDDSVERDSSKVKQLKDHMKSLSETGNDALEEEEATRSVVGDLQAYLEEIRYGGRKPTFSWENGYAADGSGSKGATKMDEIAKFKAEIRSVKGALLSARNFPSGSVRVR